MWLNQYVTERGGKERDAVFLHSSVSPFELIYVEEQGEKMGKTVGFAFVYTV